MICLNVHSRSSAGTSVRHCTGGSRHACLSTFVDAPPEIPSKSVRGAVQEARHNNLSLFRRLKQLLKDDSRVFIFFANEHHCETFPEEIEGESPNDRNDRAIRIATSWYVMTTHANMYVLRGFFLALHTCVKSYFTPCQASSCCSRVTFHD